MNPAAKHFDIVMGVDIHIIQPPGPVPPVPIPHPFIGFTWDPMDYVPILGATILVNGVPRAQAGTSAKEMPVHIPIGGVFVMPPGNEGEMFMGSSTVLADGEPFTYNSLPVLSCHSVGSLPPPRLKKKGGVKTMSLPTSTVLPIPAGKQILVGGSPTISLMGMLMKFGLAALGRGIKKFKKARKAKKAKKPRKPKTKKCTKTGHPVNVADGSVFTSFIDLEFSGPIPFKWERFWFSNSAYRGPLGRNWFHTYDLALKIKGDDVLVRLEEGRVISFPLPLVGESSFDRSEKLTLINNEGSLRLHDENRLTYYFKIDTIDKGLSEIHNLEKIEDYNGFTIQFEYVNDGALSRIIDSAGRELLFTTDEIGRITQIEVPHPEKANEKFVAQSYSYDEDDNLTVSTDALNQSMRYVYDKGLLIRETNRNGLNFYFEYNGIGEQARCFHTWGDGGIYDHKLQFSEGLTIVENSLGNKTSYYHEGGLVRKKIDANGGVTITNYNEFDDLVAERDPLGHGDTYNYDERGNRTQIIAADGAVTQIKFNASNLPEKAIDPVGGEWQWEYDDKGNLIKRTDPLGRSWLYIFGNGLLAAIIDPTKGSTLLEYDRFQNLKRLVSPDGQASWWTCNLLGQCTESTDPKGNTERRKFDLCGRVTDIWETDGTYRKLVYDGEDNLVQTRDQHQNVHFEYTGMKRMKAYTEAGTRVEFQYDKEERLTGIINENGFAYRFKLDTLGNILEEQGFDGLTRMYVRDEAGRVTQIQRPGKLATFYEHDACGRILSISHTDGTKETFTYRADGALAEAKNAHSTIKITRDIIGQVIREEQNGISVDSGYDELGMRNWVKSSMGADFSYHRNNMSDVTAVKAGDLSINFQRDALGLELEREFSGGLRSRWKRDRLGRPVNQETFTGGGFMQRSRTYQWDINDRLKEINDSKLGLARFGHDAFGNLAWSESPDGSLLCRMPDAVGNLFRTKDRKDREYGPAGQLLRSGSTFYSYDAEGNLIRKAEISGNEWRYEWNGSGMLAKVMRPDGEAVTFTYDAWGRRISKTFEGSTTYWVWDGNTPLHEWQEKRNILDEAKHIALQAGVNGGSELKQSVTTWLFEPESFAPLAKVANGKSYGIVTDHLGTPLSMHSQGGETVWSADLNNYGEVLNLYGKADDCPFRYPGQYEDIETGLYYNRFRYYDAREGLYVSQDPIGLWGGFNIYSYVRDTNIWVDQLGLAEGYVEGLHPPASDVGSKGVHFGTDVTYADGSKVEVSIRPDHKGGVAYKPSHPGKLKDAKNKDAFEKAAKKVEKMLEDPKVRAKVLNQIDNNLMKQFPKKGMEWKMLKKALERFCK